MARGRRTSLSTLVESVGEHSAVDLPSPTPTSAALADLIANPRNPRDEVGHLDDLASIAKTQLQPALVVTRRAYLGLYPDDESGLGEARWVVINGCRRLAAAVEYGRDELDIVVKDDVAQDRATLVAAAVTENIGRRDFDVIEEAKAVELLVGECGTADRAAKRLGKTKGWISQRRSLLQLAPELQEALRRGDLAVRLARSLARVPLEEQVTAWQKQQDQPGHKEPKSGTSPKRGSGGGATPVVRAFRRLDPKPADLAEALTVYLDDDGVQELIVALTAQE